MQASPSILADLTASQILALTGIAAIITTAGNLLALFLRERVFARSFEKWKEGRALEAVYRKYRDPLILGATELATRVKEVCDGEGRDYLSATVRDVAPPRLRQNWAADPYYRRYKFESTVYRLCALFGWLELYRQDVVFLETGKAKHNRQLAQAVGRLREDLADGQLNGAEDWQIWTDSLIFREEQRAIGELMITDVGGQRLVMGYAEFMSRWQDPADPASAWIETAASFLSDIGQATRDFRTYRMTLLFIDLMALVNTLDSGQGRSAYSARAKTYRASLPSWVRRPTAVEKRARVEQMVSVARGVTRDSV